MANAAATDLGGRAGGEAFSIRLFLAGGSSISKDLRSSRSIEFLAFGGEE